MISPAALLFDTVASGRTPQFSVPDHVFRGWARIAATRIEDASQRAAALEAQLRENGIEPKAVRAGT